MEIPISISYPCFLLTFFNTMGFIRQERSRSSWFSYPERVSPVSPGRTLRYERRETTASDLLLSWSSRRRIVPFVADILKGLGKFSTWHLLWLKAWLPMVGSTVKNGSDRLRKGNRHHRPASDMDELTNFEQVKTCLKTGWGSLTRICLRL